MAAICQRQPHLHGCAQDGAIFLDPLPSLVYGLVVFWRRW